MSDSSAKVKAPKPFSRLTPWQWFDRLSKVFAVVIMGMIIPLLAWAFRVENFMREGARWTVEDADLQRLEIMADVDARFDTLPPPAFRREVEEIKQLARDNKEGIHKLELAVARIDGNVANILRIIDSD